MTNFPHTSEGLRQVVDQLAERMEELQTALRPGPVLSEEEHQWVKLAIKREAQSFELRQAIITKTITGLIWSLVVAAGYVIAEYLTSHGWKR